MYTELNPFLLRWTIMAAVMAMAGVSIVILTVGKALWKRYDARRRTADRRALPGLAHGVSAR